jgi:hypothetical protein
MAILRGPIQVTTENEAPYLEQDEPALNRNMVRKAGDLCGLSGTPEIDYDSGVHSPVLDYRLP